MNGGNEADFYDPFIGNSGILQRGVYSTVQEIRSNRVRVSIFARKFFDI